MKYLILLLLLVGCGDSHTVRPIPNGTKTKGDIKVIANECIDSQCFEVLLYDDLRCIAQYRGGIWCEKAVK